MLCKIILYIEMTSLRKLSVRSVCTGVVKCIFFTRENILVILAKKNVKGCFPCEQFSVVHVSHGTIGISRASTIKRIQNILGKIE